MSDNIEFFLFSFVAYLASKYTGAFFKLQSGD